MPCATGRKTQNRAVLNVTIPTRLSRNVVHLADFLHIGKRGDKNEFIGWPHDKRLFFIAHLAWNFIPNGNCSIVCILIAMFPVTAHTKRPSRCSTIVADNSELQRRKQGTSMQIRINRYIFCHVIHLRSIINIIAVR